MRALRQPHQPLPSFTTADALWVLRMDEAGGANNLADAMGVRTMTQVASPGAAFSLFNDAGATLLRGARTFNGTTQYASRVTGDGDDALFQGRAWGFEGWVTPTALGATQVIAEYGEWSSPKTLATYVQMQVAILASGALQLAWHDSGGTFRNNATAAGSCPAGVATHIGVAVEPDPANHLQIRIRFYINGECVSIVSNRPPPAGGTSSRWIIGASANGGTALLTPGQFFGGSLDDLALLKFSPTHEFFRESYANGVCAFYEKKGVSVSGDFDTTGLQECHTRVLVEVSPDGSAWPSSNTPLALRNLTDLDLTDVGGLGIGLVEHLEYGDGIDDIGPSAALTVVPRLDFWNLSPVADSSLLVSLFQKRRRIKIEQAWVPIGTTKDGAAPYFRLMFDGWAMNPNISPKEGTLTVLGPQGPLSQAWIEPAPLATVNENAAGDRAYGSGLGTALEACIQALIDDHDPAVFTIVPATGAEGAPNGIAGSGAGNQIQIRLFGVGDEHGKGRPHPIANGDSLLVAGTGNYNGVKTANGSTTANVVQCNETSVAVAEQNGTVAMVGLHSYRGGKPAVWCPTSPSWNLYTVNEPSSKSVLAAAQAWADEIGWHFRPRWDDVRKQFRFKLYDPRVAPSPTIMTADSMYMPSGVSLKHDFQRTAGVVEYPSQANQDNKGERARYAVGYADLARNGDRYYFRVVNDAKSLITDSTAAQKELDTLKADLGGDPASNADAPIEVPADPRWEMGDGLDVLSEYATGPFQMPAVFGFESFPVVQSHKTIVERGRVRTALTLGKFGLAGSAVGQVRRTGHLDTRIAPIGRQRGMTLRAPNPSAAPGVTNLAALNTVRFAFVTWAWPVGDQNRLWDQMEVHWSTSSGFTPSAATLKAVVRGTQAHLSGFTAGVTYYVRCVAVDELGNRSAPSPQTSFVS